MGRIFALTNNKGGVTKSTTTINLGYGLARKGKRVLILDVDAQSNTTWTLTNKLRTGKKGSLYEVLMEKRPLHEVILPTRQDNLFIVPSSLLMSYAEVQLFNEPMRERRLKTALRPYLSKFDYILIDTPPNLGMLTVNALIACTDVIIPITLNEFSLIGISILLKTILELRTSAEENELDAKMPIFGVVAALTRTTLDAEDHKKNVKAYFGDLMLEPFIPLNVRVEEANNPRKNASLYDLAPQSTGAQAYTALVEKIMLRDQETTANREHYLARTHHLLNNIPTEEEEID